jgi:hypothetical protein
MDELNWDTKFRQGVDNWQFVNRGSYLASAGQCLGQSLSALDYFTRKKGDSLFGKYDNFNNNFPKTDSLTWDDRLGYRLCSVLQEEVNWDKEIVNKYTQFQKAHGPEATYYMFAVALKITNQPQLLGAYGEGIGHAVIVYAKRGDKFYVSDPNYPKSSDVRAITYNRDEGKFNTYYSGPTGDETGKPYTRFYFYNRYKLIDQAGLDSLWTQLDNGTVGSGLFPKYGFVRLEAQEDGTWKITDRITTNYKVIGDKIKLQLITKIPAPNYAVIVYNDLQQRVATAKDGAFDLELKPGKTSYAFIIFGRKDGKWRWIDGRWVNFIQSYDGSWNSGPLCGEAFETRFRWAVSLLQDDQGNLNGTLHFHNCPNGGQAIYALSGKIPTTPGPFTLEGKKFSGSGELDKNTPAVQTFTINRGQPPEPNYTP